MESEFIKIRYKGEKVYIKYIDMAKIKTIIVQEGNATLFLINNSISEKSKSIELHAAYKFLIKHKKIDRLSGNYKTNNFNIKKMIIGGLTCKQN